MAMRTPDFLSCLLLSVLALATPVQALQCSAQSAKTTTALVELYTSEGCDSCPPADRWLSSLGARGYTPDRVVPIALHVDYWDYIGWKDPYAKQIFSARQRKMASLARAAFVYTPQVLLQGRDFRGWGSGGFDLEVAKINSLPAKARISLLLDTRRGDAFDVAADVDLLDVLQQADAALYLGTYESKLVSEVKAGENRGKTLPHDYVVLEWAGPLEFKAARLAARRTLPLLPKAVPGHSGVVAFVQNRATGEVLQALMLPACPG
ncbi:MAG TPA: DUF1223 domain-containing protein [Burkholderiales bacterium]|nr:DUF1223 domain-containing protein [Burkholderiales bacterium]